MRCGTDIVNVNRIKKSIEELGEKFIKRVYTDEENTINHTYDV